MKIRKDCPVCRSTNISFCFKGKDHLYGVTKRSFSLYRCHQCEALFLNPYPSTNETADFYPKTYYSYETPTEKGFFARTKDNIIKSSFEPKTKFSFIDRVLIRIFKNKYAGLPLYRKKNGSFLDVGCGTGKNLKTLNEYGWKTSGIEIDKKAVDLARKNNLNVSQDTIESAQLKGEKFDCIRIWHVFEHLTDPHLALQKLTEHLKDDGEILLAVPNTNSFPQKVFRSYWYGLDVPRHIINYSPHTIQKILSQHKLLISELKYASCGTYLGSLSHLLNAIFKTKLDLINNVFLVMLTAPLDFIGDLLRQGDTIFLKIKKL